ncbi:Aspartic proteinase-like protein 2 [Vitis vinifera]|uniref:Aspartic proteinase-like protein 2 n=1 Tax=Vitis vinifera TaxID=29760 RepID=A0A438GD74_VITVI|nr:Aspartic proteinase-like protein 2 [Vitis vinifera]
MGVVLLLIGIVPAHNCVRECGFQSAAQVQGSWEVVGCTQAHDTRRHGRILSAVDLPLGGNGHPSEAGLYFAKIGIGTPSKDYYVQVDTGSDILWVNCAGCDRCPTKSDLGVDLTLYDMKASTTSDAVGCDDNFCSLYDGPLPGCKPGLQCLYSVLYGDGSSTTGYFVQDFVQYNRISGNFQTTPTNGTVVFGCGNKQSGELGSSSEALDGILGFGQANSSMLSQLASSGKVKKVFSHCLDNVDGGGIFAIGEVVEPKVNITRWYKITALFIENVSIYVEKSSKFAGMRICLILFLSAQIWMENASTAHYNVVMKEIEVGGDPLDVPSDAFESGDRKGTIIDSGTTLAYFPQEVYVPLIEKILSQQPDLRLHTVEQAFTCFDYTGNVDDGFPTVTLHFDKSISLTVYPHEYLFQVKEFEWCIGWQNSGAQTKDGKDLTLLGDA